MSTVPSMSSVPTFSTSIVKVTVFPCLIFFADAV